MDEFGGEVEWNMMRGRKILDAWMEGFFVVVVVVVDCGLVLAVSWME